MQTQNLNSTQPRRRLRQVLAVALSTLILAACGSSGGSESIGTHPGGAIPWNPQPGSGDTDGAQFPKPRGLSEKAFTSSGRVYSPMDILSYTLTLDFDARAKTLSGTALISFQQNTLSRPVFLLDGTVRSVKLNGASVDQGRVKDPDGKNNLVYLDQELREGETAVAEVKYTIPSDRISYTGGGVGFLTDMADLIGRFFERWAPANFEDDQFPLTIRFLVRNSTSQHQVFANGDVTQVSNEEWVVKFPAHYTSSAFFAHLTNRPVTVKTMTYQGMSRAIPVVVYSSDSGLVDKALQNLPALFQEMEADYGPYPHPGFIAYIGKSTGGMEYVGATITSLKSLAHELHHCWFARGVLPAEGRSGWIDEAIASWRDHGYKRASSLLSRSKTNLASVSEYQRGTPSNSYADGRALLGEWDHLLADRGGLKPFLRLLHERYSKKLLTTEEFWFFMEEVSGLDLEPYFERYVYAGRDVTAPQEKVELFDATGSLHPTTLTDEELEQLR